MKQIMVVRTSDDGMQLVLNVGSVDKIAPGQRFLIYAEGDELYDPLTKKSLGRLEILRGTGKAVHVQEQITTVRSDAKAEASRTIRKQNINPYNLMMGLSAFMPHEEEEILPKESLPFDNAKIGDVARLI